MELIKLKKRQLRIFTDTSVFGGCFDDEFTKASCLFFEKIKEGKIKLLLSQTILNEIMKAPIKIQKIIDSIDYKSIELVTISDEIINLRDAYIFAKIVSKKYINDAEHIAAATISRADLIVSWNFKHIVNFEKIRAYNAINLINGYKSISINSPMEVFYI